jgi:hypothetical protein
LTGSLRAAADLAGCSHHTVARVVAERDAGGGRPRTRRPRLVDEFLPKIEEWVENSKGKIRADVAHDKLLAMDFTGSERSSRRAVAAIKKQYRLGNARVHRPWVVQKSAGDADGVAVFGGRLWRGFHQHQHQHQHLDLLALQRQ